MSISDKTKFELANSFIDSINVESVNIRHLVSASGLTKSAVKELLSEIVDRCSDDIYKPSKRNDIAGDVKEILVQEYGLTYSIANRLTYTYNIEYPEQLSYLKDSELKDITGIGKSTLKKIRENFPYIEKPKTVIDNNHVSILKLPTKAEEVLYNESIVTVHQIGMLISDGDIDNLGYPLCLLIKKGYELYSEGETSKNIYYTEYLSILLQSYNRNLNNLIRHTDSRLNLHWINDTIYHFITYIYEIMAQDNIIKRTLIKNQLMLDDKREILLTKLYSDADYSNDAIIKHYYEVNETLQEIYNLLKKEI